MLEIKDRIPTYPGRVKIVPVEGQPNIYDMVRADEPIEPGTPINRALFQMFIDEMNAIRQQVNDKIFEMSQRTRVGNLADGAVFGLYENGVLVPFIKVYSNSSTKRILVVRKNCVKEDVFVSNDVITYEGGKTDVWLNNDYLSVLDAATQAVLVPHQFNVVGTDGIKTILRKVFLLSSTEYQQGNNTALSTLGSALSYFSTAERRISSLNGSPTNHWTRSNNLNTGKAAYITTNGSFALETQTTFVAGIRPAFTLPEDFEVIAGEPSTENVMATAEV